MVLIFQSDAFQECLHHMVSMGRRVLLPEEIGGSPVPIAGHVPGFDLSYPGYDVILRD